MKKEEYESEDSNEYGKKLVYGSEDRHYVIPPPKNSADGAEYDRIPYVGTASGIMIDFIRNR